MKTITLNNNQTIDVVEVYGGKEVYQGFRREYLEIVVRQEDYTLEALETRMADACETMTITDEDGVQYVYNDYMLRGGARVWQDEDSGEWFVAAKRYQCTEMERMLDRLLKGTGNG